MEYSLSKKEKTFVNYTDLPSPVVTASGFMLLLDTTKVLEHEFYIYARTNYGNEVFSKLLTI